MAKYQLEEGQSIVEYDSDTGAYTWIYACKKPFLTGKRADYSGFKGYRYLKINQAIKSASRTAWQIVHGAIPDGMEIDHINRDNTDNRIENLRVVDKIENLLNRSKTANKSGVMGVSLHRKSGLYRARFRDKTKYAATVQDAEKMYLAMKREFAEAYSAQKTASRANVTIMEMDPDESIDPSIGDDWDSYYIPRSGLPR